MRAVCLMVVFAGCFAPSIREGVPCGPGGSCPKGQTCELATNTCDGTAPVSDGGDLPDGAGVCDPTEVLVGGACTIPLGTEVSPAAVSAMGCETGDANTSRSVAIDASNRIYVAFRCGATGSVFAVASADGGASVGAAVPLGVDNAKGFALAGGARKVAYLAIGGEQGVAFAVTSDGGATWTAQVLGDVAPDNNIPAAVAAFGDRVYVAAGFGNEIRVWRNATRGMGPFESVDVAINHVYGDMFVDPMDGTVWVGGDSPALHVRKSSDGGVTFAPVINPPASYNFSEWAINNGTVFASGVQPTFARIDAADPSNAMTVNAMLPDVNGRGRALSAAADGALYVASRPASGAIALQRIAAGATTAPARNVGSGTGPSVIAGPGTAAPYVFTETVSTKVQLGVAQF